MTILILTTGGSIDKTYSTAESTFVVGEPAIEQILQEAHVQVDHDIEPLLRKDSLDITEDDRPGTLDRVSAPHRQVVLSGALWGKHGIES